MTTYTFKIKQSGATVLYTPTNLLNQDLTRSGVGQPFNVKLKSIAVSPTYLQTENLLNLETENNEYLERE
jgi:hypothetical protein